MTRPPTGYYDPSIDAQVSAGARGLGDLRIDTDTAHRRGSEDYQTTLADLMTGETRTRADYATATGNLGLQFGRLARTEAEGARTHGVTSSGLASRAAAIRAANQGREQSTLDTSLARALEDITSRRSLAERGYARQYGPGGDLDLQLARGEREQPFLESDANAQRLYQAKIAGWLPPGPPPHVAVPSFVKERPRRRHPH